MSKINQLPIIIKKLNSKAEIAATFPVLIQLIKNHQDLQEADFLEYIDEIIAEKNYQMIGAYLNEKLVGIAGYWILTRFYSGKYIQVGNMVIDENHRGCGIGKIILDFIENEGKKQNCQHFILDSKLDNKDAHKFYLKEGFEIIGYHLMKDI